MIVSSGKLAPIERRLARRRQPDQNHYFHGA
jgi:hypothetical protein